MPFPISISGAVSAPGLTVDEAMLRLERGLAEAKAVALRRERSEIRFKGGAFRPVSNWNVLVPISTGRIEVAPRDGGVTVSYRLTFTWMLVAVTLVVMVFLGPTAMASKAPPSEGLAFLPIVWLWLFGGSFVVTWWRFPRFLTRSLLRP